MRSNDSLKGPLFPGNSCYPLSPLHWNMMGDIKQMEIMDPVDQMNLILEIIGSPVEEDLEFIENPSAKDFVLNFPKKKPVVLSKIFPNVDVRLIDLLKGMLAFNPKKRPSIEEILENEIFRGLREEKGRGMEVENEDEVCRIDFETDKFYLDKKDLKLLFLRELNSFHPVKNMEVIDVHLEVLLETIKDN